MKGEVTAIIEKPRKADIGLSARKCQVQMVRAKQLMKPRKILKSLSR